MHIQKDYLRFEEIQHTADAQIRVFGKSFQELFLNAALGMYHISGAKAGFKLDEKMEISFLEKDYESLLVSFLGELLYLLEESIFVNEPRLLFKGFELSCEFNKFQLVSIEKEIKAVTYNEINIIKQRGVFQTKIVFDI